MDVTITLTENAQRNIQNMQRRVWDIENKYGYHSDEGVKANVSFQRMLMVILNWPGTVYAEDDLSLIIQSTIQLGIIWHPVKHREGETWVVDPLLGEWSSHS